MPASAIVDAHVHLWDPGRFRMPWLDGDATLQRPFELTDLAGAAEGLPLRQVVYVQVDVTPAYGLLEARWAVERAHHDRRLAGIVAWAPMEDGDIVRSYLDSLATLRPYIKGVRRLIQSEPDPDFAVRPDLIAGLRLLPEYGLSFDICIRHSQLVRTIEMVRACPDTQFVLDHVAKPDIRNHVLDPWREQMAQLAELPNVVCKISGMVTEADHAAWNIEQLRPYVSHALDVFGEQRVLFGGDWPVVTQAATYRRWVDTLESLTTDQSPAARDALWASNARRVYRLSF
jgi:predicted TIM-barrel fold metal-dependent hydrolase